MLNIKRIAVLIFSLLTSACTQTGLFLANLPASFNHNNVTHNIAYGSQSWQKLDVYQPDNINPKHSASLPVIVFFYGGSWETGNKDMYQFVGQEFANKGYITVIADYGKYPDVAFPSFIEDGAKALAWIYKSIAKFGGNPNTLYLTGHSAGAYIAAMLCADNHYLKAEGLDKKMIRAFAGLAGPYDFIPNTTSLKAIFKTAKDNNYHSMKVTSFITGNEPPMLLIWGEEDIIVYRRNIELLAQKIKHTQGNVKTIFYPEMNHTDLIKNMIWFVPSQIKIRDEILHFFEQYGAKPSK